MIFKRKKRYKDWSDLDIDTYNKIYRVTSNQLMAEDEKIYRAAAICAGITYEELMEQPIDKTTEMIRDSGFLFRRPVADKVRHTYEVNGHRYRLLQNPADMTTAQYIDYQSVIVEKYEEHIQDLLSIILVPEGKVYNVDYDMDEVKADMGHLKLTEALGITDFFLRRYRRSLRHSLLYCEAAITVARIRAPKEMKPQIREMEKEMARAAEGLRIMSGYLSLKELLR